MITAKLRYLRIAPRKVRLVADMIRGKSVEEAQAILNFTIKKGTGPLLKLLKSAVSNAKHNFHQFGDLRIVKLLVDEGPKFKRWQPRARGQAYEIQKKTSHVTIILDEIAKKTKGVKKAGESVESKESKERIGAEKPKFKPELEIKKPKIERGLKRIFRRKAF